MPADPNTTNATPSTTIEIVRVVDAPVKIREISDVSEFISFTQKIVNMTPAARTAGATAPSIEACLGGKCRRRIRPC
jgi:hypothetical protein